MIHRISSICKSDADIHSHVLHNYSFESLDRSAKIPKRPRLSDSGCTKSVFAKNELDKYKFKFRPNLKNERLKAAGGHELKVCGIVDALFICNGRTKLIKGLVTPDLTNEIIVSCKDAENIGALTLNRADLQVLKCTSSRGIVDALFTYNGRTKLMKGLVTPDLTNKIIVSCKDAENIGALTLNRVDSQVLKCTSSRKRSSP